MTTTALPPIRSVLLVLAVTVVASVALGAAGLPSPVMFGSLVGGLAHALTSPQRLTLPAPLFRLGQGLVGVILGGQVTLAALGRMGSDAVPILGATVSTIVVSILSGWLLARLYRGVSTTTGVFALIAGGASGVVAVAHELGADDRVVTVVQYLRVLVVLLSMPLLATLLFHPDSGVGSLEDGSAGLPPSLVFCALSVGLGLTLVRYVPIPTGTLLGPLLVAAVLSNAGWLGHVTVPEPLEWLAFGLIGVQVGLRFTRESLAAITRMLPGVLVLVVAIIAVCAAIGGLLAATTSVDGLTAYLATTPGGLFAVVALAADAGADLTYVTAVQLVRLIAILLLTPLLARWLQRRTPSP